MEPLSTFFLNLEPPTKQLLDKKGIKHIDELFLPKNTDFAKSLPSDNLRNQLNEYRSIKEQVFQSMKTDSTFKQPKVIQQTQFLKELAICKQATITQVYGQKGSGKTALLLQILEYYQQQRPDKSAALLNCASGITYERYCRLNHNLFYRDIYSLMEIVTLLKEFLTNSENIGIIVIDQALKFLKIKQKPQQQFISLICLLKDLTAKRNIKVIFSNGVGPQKIRLYNDEPCFNNLNEFGSAISQFLDNRISTNRTEDNVFLMVLLKSKRLFQYQTVRHFKITGTGIEYYDSHLDPVQTQ